MKEDNFEIEADFSNVSEILVSAKALEKIFTYARAVDSEIGGLMIVDESGEKPLIKDCLLSKQKVSGVEMELDPDSLAKMFEEEALKKKSRIENAKGWWHSHVNMGTFWSSTDDDCFGNMLNTSQVVYGVVITKNGSILGRIDIKTPIGVITINKVKITPWYGNKANTKYVKEAKDSIIIEKIKPVNSVWENFKTKENYYYDNRPDPIQYVGSKKEKKEELFNDDYAYYGRTWD